MWAGAFPVELEVGQLDSHPALIQPEHARLVAPSLLPDATESANRGWHVDHREPPTAGDRLCKDSVRPLDFHGGLVGGQAVAEAPVDRRLRGIECRQRLAAFVHVIQLTPHHRRQQSPPAMGGLDTDPSHTAAWQRASRQGHLIGENAGSCDDLGAIEKCQGSIELGDLRGDRQFLVGWKRRPKGTPHEGRIRPLLLRPDRPKLKPRGRAYRWTSARARHGLPEPLTSFSGATTRTAPVGGSLARLASCVSPYLLAPRRNRWQGNGGLKEWAAPASVPTVSTPTPTIGASFASH